MRTHKLTSFALFAALCFLASSCTILTVGNMVKNGFGKAVMKGKPQKAADYATPGFAAILKSFSKKEFKMFMGLGVSVGNKKGAKGAKGPKVKYHSFSSSGNKALLVMKQGTTRLKFYCRKVKGEWKVDDMVITGGTLRLSLRDIMGIFKASVNIFNGLQNGVAPGQHLDGDLATVLAKVAPALAPMAKLMGREWRNTKKTKSSKSPGEKTLDRFTIKTNATGGMVQIVVKGVTLRADLTRRKDLWRFSSVRIDIPRREPFYLSTILRVAFPWLSLFNQRNQITSAKVMEERVLSLMSPGLATQLKPFVQFGVAWLLAQPKMTRGETTREAYMLPTELFERLSWKIGQEDLRLSYDSPKIKAQLLLDREGLVQDMEVLWGNLRITPVDLAGFIPMVHFARKGFSSLSTPKERAAYVKEALGFLARPLRTGVENNIPDRITLPLKTIFAAATGRFDRKESGRDLRKQSALAHFTIKKTAGGDLQMGLPVGTNHKIIATFTHEEKQWKIASVRLNNMELTSYVVLLPSFIRFIEGSVQLDATLLASSLGDKLGTNMEKGLALMMKLHGKRLRKLGLEVTLLTMARLMENRALKNSGDKSASETFQLPKMVKNAQGLSVIGEHYQLEFALKKDGSYGFDYPPCVDPPHKKGKRRSKKHSLCFEGYARQEPFQLLELIPFGVGYFMGLEGYDYKSLRAFSAPEFYKGFWRKLPPGKLSKLLKKYKVSISLPTAAELVDMIMLPLGHKKMASQKKSMGHKSGVSLRGRGFIFKRDRRYPFAELWLSAKGKEIDVSFAWDKTRLLWVIYDIKVKMGFLGKVSVKKLVNAL
ncbi:hypothetical protein KKF84_22130 [Myxococcota bacterium]|nr:hypothetical protein [Myxococcota bacterium]MBU1538027.1 hypothetical protein [Myxococcota bacterium]